MDGNGQRPYDVAANSNGGHESGERVSVEQLRHLVHLLDRSDVSEVEVKRADVGMRLVLRKAKGTDLTGSGEVQVAVPVIEDNGQTTVAPTDAKHTITAPLVGIFHTWAKPRGGALVGIGDRVKVGQLVATIQSLNVINEIEAPIAGRVIEMLVQDGQPVEYGQALIVVDSAEE